jgi:hypothetical protein
MKLSILYAVEVGFESPSLFEGDLTVSHHINYANKTVGPIPRFQTAPFEQDGTCPLAPSPRLQMLIPPLG